MSFLFFSLEISFPDKKSKKGKVRKEKKVTRKKRAEKMLKINTQDYIVPGIIPEQKRIEEEDVQREDGGIFVTL